MLASYPYYNSVAWCIKPCGRVVCSVRLVGQVSRENHACRYISALSMASQLVRLLGNRERILYALDWFRLFS